MRVYVCLSDCDATCQKAAWKEHKKTCAARKKKPEGERYACCDTDVCVDTLVCEYAAAEKKQSKDAALAKQIQAAMNRASGGAAAGV